MGKRESSSEFASTGQWWLHGNAERPLVGRLTFGDDTGATLEVAGQLVESEDDEEFGQFIQGWLIHGRAEGKTYCLVNATLRSSRGYAHGTGSREDQQTFHSYQLLEGWSSPNTEEVLVTEWQASFSSAEEWYGAAPFRHKHTDGTTPQITVNLPHDLVIDLPLGRLTIGWTYAEANSITKVEIESHLRFLCQFTEPVPRDQTWPLVERPLQYLLRLLADRPIEVVHEAVRLDGVDEVHGWLEVHRQRRWSGHSQTNDDIRAWEIPFKLVHIPNLQDTLAAWFALFDAMQPGILMVFAALDSTRSSSLENSLLNAALACEHYHRHHPRMTQYDVSIDEHKARLRRVMSAIERTDRPWVNQRLQFAREVTFGDRLKELRAHAGQVSERLLSGAELSAVVAIRNGLTHGTLESPREDAELEHMVAAKNKLDLLLRLALFMDLGFDEATISGAIARSPRYAAIMDQRL
jgi:hypothetical protein